MPDELDRLGQQPAHGGGAAVQVDLVEEELVAGDLHVVGDADEPDVPAGAHPAAAPA
jgi:hypothetical protein